MRKIIFKILPEHFNAIILGLKTFEHRTDLKGLEVGDSMILCEIHSLENKTYTGKNIEVIASQIYELPTDGFIVSFNKWRML